MAKVFGKLFWIAFMTAFSKYSIMILFTFMLQYIYQECSCMLTADQLSYSLLYVSYHSHCMHGSRPWIREPAPSDPAHVRYVNTYRELEHFLIHFLICSYLLNYHVNPTQVLGCLAVRIARIWITSQMIRHWLGHVMWYLWEPKIRGSQLSVTERSVWWWNPAVQDYKFCTCWGLCWNVFL